MEEDRSALFNQLKNFSQRKLKKVETKVVTGTGEQLVEKRGAKGLQVLTGGESGARGQDEEPPRKLDLQVGLVLPGLLLGSQDVAHDKSSLDSYGITHILNLDSGVQNKYEDDYNYKNINMNDKPDYNLQDMLEDTFDFIDDGRHYGNVLIHCSGTIGLSRSTTICIAYLMNKEKQKFDEALNNVKEARSFVKPNEGFVKQLRDYEVKLRGAQQVKDSGIDDPFALRKKQEIEQEKAMVAGASSVKNRMKMFGATLDTGTASRSKSVSPSPFKSPSIATGGLESSNRSNKDSLDQNRFISKTPEPRKSWQTNQDSQVKPSWSSSAKSVPPPPPPPMPTNLLDDNKSAATKSLNSSRSNNGSSLPPPPPPQPSADFLKGSKSSGTSTTTSLNEKVGYEPQTKEKDKQRMVFGKVPPPAMKIIGGLSIEKTDPQGEKNMGFSRTTAQAKSSLQLPLKKQFTIDSGNENENPTEQPRAPSPSAALRAAKQQVAAKQSGQSDSSSGNASGERKQSTCGQLNRSSTKKLLNLIKTKTRSDLTLPDGDENDEIEALLGALENESIENIDWDELGLDEDEVKDIINQGEELSSSSSSSESEEEDDEEEDEEGEVETSSQHFVIRTK